MERFILRYRGSGAMPEQDSRVIRSHPDLSVVDETPRMLLVEGKAGPVYDLAADLKNWAVSKEVSYAIPDPRMRIAR